MKFTTAYKRPAAFVLAIALASILGCASTAAKDGSKIAAEDAAITNKVIKAINAEPTLKSAQIGVQTSNGVVLLTGYVDSLAAENTATELARNIDCVKLVRDAIRVK